MQIVLTYKEVDKILREYIFKKFRKQLGITKPEDIEYNHHALMTYNEDLSFSKKD